MRAETIKPLPSTLLCLPSSLRCMHCSYCPSLGWAGGKQLSPTPALHQSLTTDQCESHQHRWVLLVPEDNIWQGKARVFQQSWNSTMPSADAAELWLLSAFSAPDSTPKHYGSKKAGQEQARAVGLCSHRQSTNTKSAGVVAPSEALLQLPLPGEGDQTFPRSTAVPVAASIGGVTFRAIQADGRASAEAKMAPSHDPGLHRHHRILPGGAGPQHPAAGRLLQPQLSTLLPSRGFSPPC